MLVADARQRALWKF